MCQRLLDTLSGCHDESTREVDEKVRERQLLDLKARNEQILGLKTAAQVKASDVQAEANKRIRCDRMDANRQESEKNNKISWDAAKQEIEQIQSMNAADGKNDYVPTLPASPPPAKRCTFNENMCKCE